mmetsp:Transcript_12103/g.21272  ORF Transcript_12103/g.21272 Transcript_12103/m.21272 type:complete len:222 (+) Transcript_12103:1163-1828(+)
MHYTLLYCFLFCWSLIHFALFVTFKSVRLMHCTLLCSLLSLGIIQSCQSLMHAALLYCFSPWSDPDPSESGAFYSFLSLSSPCLDSDSLESGAFCSPLSHPPCMDSDPSELDAFCSFLSPPSSLSLSPLLFPLRFRRDHSKPRDSNFSISSLDKGPFLDVLLESGRFFSLYRRRCSNTQFPRPFGSSSFCGMRTCPCFFLNSLSCSNLSSHFRAGVLFRTH